MLRAVGLRGAVAINVCAMIGAGPLVTIPLVVAALNGSVSVIVWVAGALIALCDGLVFAELASAFPRTGGTYAYLREAFGARGPGRLIAFLFVWQYLFWAPLVIASGYVGFAQYAGYLVPPLATNPLATHVVAAALGLVALAAVWRAIPHIARIATVLGAIAVATLAAVALAGFVHPHPGAAAVWLHAFDLHGISAAAFGAALVIVLYDYSGYADITALGEEVIAPQRTLPSSIALAVAIVGVAYLALNLGVFTAVPAAEVAKSTSVASLVVERAAGPVVAGIVTVAVLVTAFASTYGLLVAAARIPFAAARDGDFLPPFARLHGRLHFPHVTTATIGLAAVAAAFLPLDALIAALTAGIALVQGAGQCVAVATIRAAGVRAPYRLPFFPLPPLIALAGWIVLFVSSGPAAMLFGIGTLVAGAVVFLVHASRVRAWPFAAAAAAAAALIVAQPHAAWAAPSWGHAAVVVRDAEPQLEVDGKPFFFWGGAFFYERIPARGWRSSMLAMKELGANTLDLYVPWNWHETADGEFDFDGHTNPRRNLREVLRLARELDLHLIVRPGPVIRNEWRNGGYPAWLLTRPEYAMPLADVLEGRYPATATLQNAHSDDAAAEWMRNATHMRYASRWLQTALREFTPVADLVLAVQLDDDQGAYIDNQTYPAPNLVRYLQWLEAQSRTVIGPVTPAFINTFQMRVPSSLPVWTMGNWYQSDADIIGEHDRAQLDVSTAMLEANARGPLAQSEFQAGWLAGAEDPVPRSADPTNTALALHDLIARGSRGIIDFPMQDTLAPFGWEAPWSNALYAWDAAIRASGARGSRWSPTHDFGREVRAYGTALATAHRPLDAAILWTAGALRGTPSVAQSAALLARVTELLRTCTDRGLACRVLAPGDARAARARQIVVPEVPGSSLSDDALRWLGAQRNGIAAAAWRPGHNDDGETLLLSPHGNLLDVQNWRDRDRTYPATRRSVEGRTIDLPAITVHARSAALIPLGVAGQRSRTVVASDDRGSPAACNRDTGDTIALSPAPSGLVCARLPAWPAAGTAVARFADVFEDGGRTIVVQNDRVRAIVTPDGGGRIVAFALRDGPNATDATGALRDGITPSPPPSTRDYIAPYTHDYPAGTAQRPYDATIGTSPDGAAVVHLTGALRESNVTFERTLTLAPGSTRLVIDERIDGAPVALVSRSSLPFLRAAGPSAAASPHSVPPDSGGLSANQRTGENLWTFAVSWRPEDITAAAWTPYRSTGTLALTLAPGWRRVTYSLARVADEAAALRFAEAERAWVRANPGPVRTTRGSGGTVDATASKAVE